eukprot:4161435-Prymnesium_polylepis.1
MLLHSAIYRGQAQPISRSFNVARQSTRHARAALAWNTRTPRATPAAPSVGAARPSHRAARPSRVRHWQLSPTHRHVGRTTRGPHDTWAARHPLWPDHAAAF